MKTIQQLQAEYDDAAGAFSAAKEAYQKALNALNEARKAAFFIQPGYVISTPKYSRLKVIGLFIHWGDICIEAVAPKTNGDWGIAVKMLYSHDIRGAKKIAQETSP